MKKILFALMVAVPLSWSLAAIAQDAPAAGGDAPKADADKKPEKKEGKKGKKKKADKKDGDAPKAE
jgi:hypothetical protein